MKLHLITAEGERTRWMRRGRLIRFPQLTMPLVAALTPAGVFDEIHHTDEIVDEVRFDCGDDLVGITATTCAAPHAYDLADEFRARGVRVVLGGPHPTLMPQEAKQHADAVVVGEAEEAWPRLVHDFANGRLAPFYRSKQAPSLAGLPWARRDLIAGRSYGRGVVIATRGCPHRCGYCMLRRLYHPGQRRRPVEEVVAEVESIRERAVIFWDDNLTADRDYARRLFRALAPLKKWWTSQATLDLADDPGLLALAAESGCEALFAGLESVNAASLAETHKGFNQPRRYREAIRRFHEAGIAVQAGVVFGFDHDDPSVFARTVEALEAAAVDVASIGSLTPFPGTELFRRLEREGRILTRDWSLYDARSAVVFRPRRMSPDELQAGLEWATRQFYSLGSIARRLGHSRQGLWWNLPRNLGYKLAFEKLGLRGFNPAAG
ncbi:MAG: radical SAM protein [Myxococcales bacterium]